MEKSVKKYWPFFIIPTLGAFTIGFIIPFFEGLYLSFCKFTTVKNAEWVGLKNYIYILTKEKTGFAAPGGFLDAFLFTTKFTVVSVILINVFAFALALALTKGIKGTNVFRTIFFMPNLIGGVVLGYIWKTLINCVLSLAGQPLLALNSTAGYWGLIILMCWQQIGYMMIVYIAGLQSVPDSVLEAAKIDGANSWKTLIKVKIPMVMSSITVCLFLTLSNSFKLFDQNMALTNGQPYGKGKMTEMLALNIYNTFYARSGKVWKGYGQAKAVVFCVIVMLISLIQLKATRSKEVQQ